MDKLYEIGKCELIFVWPSQNSVDWYARNGFESDNEILEYNF